MPDTLYKIKYVVDNSQALKALLEIDAALLKTQGNLKKTAAILKTVGQNSPGLTAYLGSLKKVDNELKNKVTDSRAAEAALKKVGNGNTALTSLAKRVEALKIQLATMTAQAISAQTALGGVGTGVNLPSSGKGTPSGGGSGGRGIGVGGAVAVSMGVMAGRAALRAAGDAGKSLVELMSDSASGTKDFREGLREYASLRGAKAGPDDRIVREALDFSVKAGVLPEEITPFLTEYENSSATGRMKGNVGGVVGKNGFTQDQQDALEAQLKIRGAQFASRTGLDAKTAGDLTGLVSTYQKLGNETDLAGQLGGMHYGLDQGRGDITPLARGELGQAGSAIASNRVSGLPELGAFIGVASVVAKTAASSGTTYGQMSRFLNETGLGNEEQETFVKESGMKAARGDFAKLKALRDHLAKVKPDDVNSFLEAKGYGNSTDRRSVIGMLGNVDVLEQRISRAKEIAANGQDVIARDNASQAGDNARDRQSVVRKYQSEIEIGMRSASMSRGQDFARARMLNPNQEGGQQLKAKGFTVAQDMYRTVTGYLDGVNGEDQRVNAEAIRGLIEGGKQVGVDIPSQYPSLFQNLMGQTQNAEAFAADYASAAESVSKAGGDPYSSKASTALRNAADALDADNRDRERMMRDGGKSRRDLGPRAAPGAGNGGAGVNPGRR